MEDSTDLPPAASAEDAREPGVRTVLDGDVARITVTGELTEAARRPIVRELTELLLGPTAPHAVEVELGEVVFMNSAGMAVLVQLQRMTAPRGIEVVLVEPPPVVVRPLQLSGLWRRFPIRQEGGGDGEIRGAGR